MAIEGITSFAPRCGFCDKTGKLLRCSRCKVMHYCNKEHQSSHRASHKSACNNVHKQTGVVEVEEEKIRNNPGDLFMPPNAFETHVGHFWGLFEIRDYMRARFGLVEALRKIKTPDSTQAQLDHLMDMLRLCRGDNMGVRDLVPALMLRLNKDQECYDFVKWWRTTGCEGDYDWGDMDLPYLDIHNADSYEPVDFLCGRWISLSQTAAIILLKIKLLFDLEQLQDSTVVGKKVPAEILDRIQTHLSQSPITAANRDVIESTDHTNLIEELTTQIEQLYEAIKENNEHFWPGLLNPTKHLNARPEAYSHGSVEEMQLALKYSYMSWAEREGALELIKHIHENGSIWS